MKSPPNTARSASRSAAAGGTSTWDLLVRVRGGDAAAVDLLVQRYLPDLRRWASGRLPGWARQATDTDDLVQMSLISVFKRIEAFEYRGEGALLAYLRQAVLNRIRNEIRAAGTRPTHEALQDGPDATRPSPLEAAIGAEMLEAYETALATMPDHDREAIVARVELGLSYPELADALGKPSAAAARMAVTRALVRLTEEMDRVRTVGPHQPPGLRRR